MALQLASSLLLTMPLRSFLSGVGDGSPGPANNLKLSEPITLFPPESSQLVLVIVCLKPCESKSTVFVLVINFYILNRVEYIFEEVFVFERKLSKTNRRLFLTRFVYSFVLFF